jgi:diguanylate cyclase (GGDEF)-like protein
VSQDAKKIDFLKRKVEREKVARTEAEQLLELKSRELYIANQQLITSNQNLDQIVAQRTNELRQAQLVAETSAIALKESLDRLKLIIQASGATTWDWDLTDNTFKCTGTTDYKLSCSCSTEASDTYDNFINIIHWDDKQRVIAAFNSHLVSGPPVDLECRFLNKQGQYRWFHIVGQVEVGSKNNTSRMVGSFADIHERRESAIIIEKMAHFDALTDVPNRSFFNRFIKDTIAASQVNNRYFALLIIDLNDFKIINDRYGHQAGDTLLFNVASILKSHIKKGHDLVARLGGDEFALILNELPPFGTLDNICNTLINACAKPIDIAGNQLATNLSIGIAHYPKDGETPERLLRCADIAMYAAKQNKVSGSTFAYYQRDLDAEHTRKRSLRDEIENGLKKQQFHLEFQPCVEISTGMCHSCEALLRWPQKPSAFTIQDVINVAEESGLILQLGKNVIDQACRFIAELEARNMPQKIGVNLSAIQFKYQDLQEIFNAAIKKHQINPKHLQVEVTENLFLGNMDHVVDVLKKLGELGIEIYIDDFGTGYSSLKYLQILPVDWVKIDKSFIHDLGVKDESLQIIQAVIKMTHSMGRRVVAEGVETENQYTLLKEIGCNVAQGYYLSPALLGTDCIEWIRANQPFESKAVESTN